MGKKKIYVLFLTLGICGGLFWGLRGAKADAPPSNIAIAPAATAFYDERWRAEQAVVSQSAVVSPPPGPGYISVPIDLSAADPTIPDVANYKVTTLEGKTIRQVERAPKMVITRWRVTGHIHFE